jgi:hypothetical protein
VVEQLIYTQSVGGSNPSSRILFFNELQKCPAKILRLSGSIKESDSGDFYVVLPRLGQLEITLTLPAGEER